MKTISEANSSNNSSSKSIDDAVYISLIKEINANRNKIENIKKEIKSTEDKRSNLSSLFKNVIMLAILFGFIGSVAAYIFSDSNGGKDLISQLGDFIHVVGSFVALACGCVIIVFLLILFIVHFENSSRKNNLEKLEKKNDSLECELNALTKKRNDIESQRRIAVESGQLPEGDHSCQEGVTRQVHVTTPNCTLSSKEQEKANALYSGGLYYLSAGDYRIAKTRFQTLLQKFPGAYPEKEIIKLIEEAESAQQQKTTNNRDQKEKAEQLQENNKADNCDTRVTTHTVSIEPKVETGMYSWIPEIKSLFASFLPAFQEHVTCDDDAWQRVNISHMTWASDAVDLKRRGKYLEACKLYFPNIVQNGSCTMGWAQGVFKTLAVAGDIEDALAFGHAWANKNSQTDMLTMHWATLLNICQNKESLNQLPNYLQSISGNPSYSVDLNRTDLYTSKWLLILRGEDKESKAEQERKRKAEAQRRKAEEEQRRKAEEERKKQEEERLRKEAQRKTEEARRNMQTNTAGMKKVSSFHTKVVGVTYNNDDGSDRQRIIRDLIKDGTLAYDAELLLIPEPTNPYDRNCIRVVASNGQQIGNLSREVAARVAPQMSAGSVFRAYVSSHSGGDAGFSYGINILVEQFKKQSTNSYIQHSSGYDPIDDDDYDYDIEPIDAIASSEGFSIDDDGHWIPIDDSERYGYGGGDWE